MNLTFPTLVYSVLLMQKEKNLVYMMCTNFQIITQNGKTIGHLLATANNSLC